MLLHFISGLRLIHRPVSRQATVLSIDSLGFHERSTRWSSNKYYNFLNKNLSLILFVAIPWKRFSLDFTKRDLHVSMGASIGGFKLKWVNVEIGDCFFGFKYTRIPSNVQIKYLARYWHFSGIHHHTLNEVNVQTIPSNSFCWISFDNKINYYCLVIISNTNKRIVKNFYETQKC